MHGVRALPVVRDGDVPLLDNAAGDGGGEPCVPRQARGGILQLLVKARVKLRQLAGFGGVRHVADGVRRGVAALDEYHALALDALGAGGNGGALAVVYRFHARVKVKIV